MQQFIHSLPVVSRNIRGGEVDSKIVAGLLIVLVVGAGVWWLSAPSAIRVSDAAASPEISVHPVSGKVFLAGKRPAQGASIVLIPVETENLAKFQPRGQVDGQGNFKLTTYSANDGAPAGDYKAIVFTHENPDVASATPPLPIPPAYADPEKSPVRVTILEGENLLPPIILKK